MCVVSYGESDMDGNSFDVVHLHADDTGFDGVVQLQTRVRGGAVRFYPNLIELDKYISISLLDFSVVNDTAKLTPLQKDMVIYYLLKHWKYILRFWYYGHEMDSSERLELYTAFQPITIEEMLSHKL